MWRTEENMILAVIKSNLEKGYNSKEQTEWLVDKVEELQDKLSRQYKHEDYLLNELDKRGYFDNLF
ncbi:hypothetical protein [Virgibacillus sp. CBA3643]|uniref:hypothetical protein n=1 Tax=Virgibacillus sp. CBA3643 TaxID=2942278 RepID=UPI0035A33554